MVNNVELKGPVVMASGKALRKNGGYGSFLGTGAAPGELAKVMKGLLKENINQVKVLVSGIVSFKEYSKVGGVQFTLKELEQIVRIAADHGLKVMAHASSDEAVQICIKAGVHSIEHGYFISVDSLKAMADQRIAWVPTVVPVAVQNQGLDGSLTAETAVIEHTYRRQLQMIRLAQKLGVILGVGTDAGAVGVQHGTGYLRELQLYQEAGLTAEETLMAATRNGAYIIGMQDSLGVISPGRPAYLLVLEGDILKYLIRPRQGMTAEGTFQSA
jgi:imidazolonepropionase-like amidohydrolase